MEEKAKNQLDYEFDLYRNNEDIKYRDKRFPASEFYKLRGSLMEKEDKERKKIWKQLNL